MAPPDIQNDDRDAQDRLDRALDGAAGSTWPDPALLATADSVRDLYAHGGPPDPDAAFVRRLEETLMESAATTIVTGQLETASMNGHRPVALPTTSSLPRPITSTRRVSAGALATAAAVMSLIGGIAFGGWLASSGGDDGSSGVGAVQDGTPGSPTLDGCRIAPGDTMAVVVLERAFRSTTLFPAPEPVYEHELPTGAAASPDVVADIESAVREIFACEPYSPYTITATEGTPAPGERPEYVVLIPDGGDSNRLAWLYTAYYLLRANDAGNGTMSVWAPESTGSLTIRDARNLLPGQVGVIIDNGSTSTFVIFVEQDGRWLVDEVAFLTESPATPEMFAPDYRVSTQFGVNFRSEPNGRSPILRSLPAETPLQFLGETAPTDNPGEDGPRWLMFQVAEGDIGWLREIDVTRSDTAAPLEASSMVPTLPATPTFAPTHQSNPTASINFRSEPSRSGGDSTIITVVPPGTPLLYLNEEAPAENPAEDGDRWLLFRIADGTEGWLRAIDVEPYRETDS